MPSVRAKKVGISAGFTQTLTRLLSPGPGASPRMIWIVVSLTHGLTVPQAKFLTTGPSHPSVSIALP